MTEQSLATAPRRGVSRRLLVLGLVMVVAVAYLIYAATQDASVYYYTVGEVLGDSSAVEGRSIRVQGTVADGSILQDETRLWINFDLTDGVQRIPVVYESTPPDLLGYSTEDRYQDVIVEGSLDAEGILQARHLLVQHGADFESVDSFADGD
ncbi:MAG: cytochrome c maturation protein CcmE [Chloroflexota bacterium]|jgi:cytochrome c-type biogenesis protein CcmE|nr:cytochrome c maturation protein CcmE [Chloroflexota bacterium]MDP6508150.1 cytochrome c maturation protein CcmE [Chloroflexota bacterium]MDP6758307.1 cytochrome c maturation protein CcmE [Chloroflexota bacterium]|tara:strand:+ start:32 stop:487 length:456 start_codon:yes stop_codon:yes gene_type:complete